MTGIPLSDIAAGLSFDVPFVPPEALERARGRAFRARLGANESGFGPAPRVIETIRRAADEVWMYGDPEHHDLRAALARHHRVRPENVVVGEGIDGLFSVAVRIFLDPGVAVATSLGAYPTFNYCVAAAGGRLVTTPYVDDREDPEQLLALAVRERARILFFANPDNPMGSWWDAGAVDQLIRSVPDGMVLFLDEAYAEFAPPGTIPTIDAENSRVLRFRTFSKAHGLAGARVGYAIGAAAVIQVFDRIRMHFGVSRISQEAALVALEEQAYVQEIVARVARGRERLALIARSSGLVALPSATNFVALDTGRDGAYARRLRDELLARDVFVRMPGVAPLDRCLRVTVGPDPDLDLLAQVLPEAVAAAA